MLLWLIMGCEIGFWIALILGLFIRYVIQYPKFGSALLLCIPLLDLILLCATAIDLHKGATAEFAHGLAAIYLAFTLVYGHEIIRWADQYVVSRLAYGNGLMKTSRYGRDYTIYEWKQWLKGVAAGSIAALLLLIAIIYVNNPEKTVSLNEWFDYIFWFLAIWFVCWPLWYTIFPKKDVS